MIEHHKYNVLCTIMYIQTQKERPPGRPVRKLTNHYHIYAMETVIYLLLKQNALEIVW